MSTVGIKYKCRCMSERADLQVPERKLSVDVVLWLNDIVMPRVAADHRLRSPTCREKTLEECMLPAPPDKHIGSKEKT